MHHFLRHLYYIVKISCPAIFNSICRFNIPFTSTHHLLICSARKIQPMSSYLCWNIHSNIILPSAPTPPKLSFSQVFLLKPYTHFSSAPHKPHALTPPPQCYHPNIWQGVDYIWNVVAHAQKPDFVFRQNGQIHLNRHRCQFSRLLAAKVCTSAVVMLDTCSKVVWRVLATHSIHQFPLHFPSQPSCAITFQLDSTTNCEASH